jgi:hypothetical protein
MIKIIQNNKYLFLILIVVFVVLFFVLPRVGMNFSTKEKNTSEETLLSENPNTSEETENTIPEEEPIVEEILAINYLETPVPLKAVYMSSWVASSKSLRQKIVDLAKRTEINSIVIDVKDYSGKIAFKTNNELINSVGSSENRVRDMKEPIEYLHENNIYVIGRIAVFQDPFLAKKWREDAVTELNNKDALWKDNKCKREIARGKEELCTYWVDMGSPRVWDYIVAVGEEAHKIGFDELNFDYIRFPTDGNMQDIYFPKSQGKNKTEVVTSFFKYLHNHFVIQKEIQGLPRPKISADIFGMVTTNTDDLNIGQHLESLAPYFDYIAPMVYPSHYPNGWSNISKPAEKPYEVIKLSMSKPMERLIAIGEDPKKLRPWLQDFNLGAIYTPDMVKAQIKAVNDIGLDSWMLWDPANTYTEGALLSN